MNLDSHVDRPSPRFPWWIWLWMIGFDAFFITFPFTWAGGDFRDTAWWLLIAVPGVALVEWQIFDVRYEVTCEHIRARAGFNRTTLRWKDVNDVRLERSSWAVFFPRNLGARAMANGTGPYLFVGGTGMRNLLITPTNPEEMRDEILRRRDAARARSR